MVHIQFLADALTVLDDLAAGRQPPPDLALAGALGLSSLSVDLDSERYVVSGCLRAVADGLYWIADGGTLGEEVQPRMAVLARSMREFLAREIPMIPPSSRVM